MKKGLYYLFLFVLALSIGCTQGSEQTIVEKSEYKPWEDLGELFHDVQMAGIFADSKTFVDCVPKSSPEDILSRYNEEKESENFDLDEFVKENFEIPVAFDDRSFSSEKPFETHLNDHWEYLTRSTKQIPEYTTLIPLPDKYIVPGGRFREIYYWDSYFSMIGLGVSNRADLIKAMLDNFSYLIDTVGFIPNGNRNYFEGRSQPPFYGAMVNLYAQMTSEEEAAVYLPYLIKEYNFWMEGAESLTEDQPVFKRVVLYKGKVLNRYHDEYATPRPESYREDVELAEEFEGDDEELFLHLRAACESGWDFSSRWFEDNSSFVSIRTSDIIPVDLNSLLYNLENVISTLYRAQGKDNVSITFLKKAEERYQAMNELFWNEESSLFQDIIWTDSTFNEKVTAASFYPMYFKLSTQQNADKQVPVLLNNLLQQGGILTTTVESGQQWDAPNGWAPLQWISVKGLEHYGFDNEASDIANRWLSINQKVYENTGKMMEKYNVMDTTLLAGGGEYPNQDGFGWTNGVALGLMAEDAKY